MLAPPEDPFARRRSKLHRSFARGGSFARRGISALVAGLVGASSMMGRSAWAEEPPEPLDPEEGAVRAAAPDRRTGHVLLAGKVAFSAPLGSIASGLGTNEIASSGIAFGGDLGIGLSRYVVLEASAAYSFFGGTCADCSANAFDAGLGFAYHLSQGFAFDPWMSFGAGYRMASFTVPAGSVLLGGVGNDTYQGLDVARVRLGAEYFPVPSFGFGPYLEADIGTYLTRPAPDPGASTYAFFLAGIRLTLDPLQ